MNRDLLYAGTEYGLFISLDGGKHWQKQTHLPTVPVHDLAVHPRDRDLVIGTHGRGIYIMDVAPLQQMSAAVLTEPAHLFTIRPATAYRRRLLHNLGIKAFRGENPPYGASIYLLLRETPKETPSVAITDAAGKQVIALHGQKVAGLQRIAWRLAPAGTPANVYRPVPSGTYTATVNVDGVVLRQPVHVRADE